MLLTTAGQWMQEDPIQQGAGQSNFREYAGNDPTNATDPSGLQTSVTPGDAQKINQNAKDIKLLSSVLKFTNVKKFKELQEERMQLGSDLSSGQNPKTKEKYTKAEIVDLLSRYDLAQMNLLAAGETIFKNGSGIISRDFEIVYLYPSLRNLVAARNDAEKIAEYYNDVAEELDGEIKQLNDLLKNAPYKNNPELREKIQGLINNAEPNTDIWKGHVKEAVVDVNTFEFLYDLMFIEAYG